MGPKQARAPARALSTDDVFAEVAEQTRRADEGPQNPGKLAAQQQVARQPGEQNAPRHRRIPAQMPQELRQP